MSKKILNPNAIILLLIIKKELHKEIITKALKKKLEDLEEEIKEKAG